MAAGSGRAAAGGGSDPRAPQADAFRPCVGAREGAAAWNRLAAAAIAGGDLLRGKASLERSLTLDPQRAGAWTSLAALCVELGELRQAQQACRRARGPGARRALAIMGTVAFKERAFARAERCFAKAIKVGAGGVDLTASHAVALLHLGRFEESARAFGAAARVDPSCTAPGTIGDFAGLVSDILGGRARTGFELRLAGMRVGAQERAFKTALQLLQRFGQRAEAEGVGRLWLERFPASAAARHFADATSGAPLERASASFVIETSMAMPRPSIAISSRNSTTACLSGSALCSPPCLRRGGA
jgi:Tfp pilus assembly protein PilF